MDIDAPPPDDSELPAMVAALAVRAASEDLGERWAAIEEIYELACKIGPKVASAIPTLMGGLLDADPKIGESALWALGYCRPDSIEPLVECLALPQSFVRERAAHALGNIGDQARAAAPALRRLLSDGDQAGARSGT
jgi:HEAT repeat protein